MASLCQLTLWRIYQLQPAWLSVMRPWGIKWQVFHTLHVAVQVCAQMFTCCTSNSIQWFIIMITGTILTIFTVTATDVWSISTQLLCWLVSLAEFLVVCRHDTWAPMDAILWWTLCQELWKHWRRIHELCSITGSAVVERTALNVWSCHQWYVVKFLFSDLYIMFFM